MLCPVSRTSLAWAHLWAGAAEPFWDLTSQEWCKGSARAGVGFPTLSCILRHSCTLPASPILYLPNLTLFLEIVEALDTSHDPPFKMQRWLLRFYNSPVGRGFPHCWFVLQLVNMWHIAYLEYSESLFNGFLLFSLHTRCVETKTKAQRLAGRCISWKLVKVVVFSQLKCVLRELKMQY